MIHEKFSDYFGEFAGEARRLEVVIVNVLKVAD